MHLDIESFGANPYYLDGDDIKNWASMEFWQEHEAILLSVGLNPRRKGDTVTTETAMEITDKYEARQRYLRKFNEDDLETSISDTYAAQTKYIPSKFAVWAKTHFSSFPPKLLELLVPAEVNICNLGDAMDIAEKLVDSARIGKTVSDSINAQNASGPRPHIRYAKVQAAYHALLNIRNGCTCTSINLEKVVFNEILEEVLLQYPKINESKMKDYYVKQGVNLAMKNNSEATTRIFNLNGHWDKKWLDIQCKIHGNKQ